MRHAARSTIGLLGPVLGVLAGAASCSLVVGFPDRAAAPDDSAAPRDDAPLGGDALDATDSSDGRGAADADATGDADADGTRFCNTFDAAPTFCEDFEGPLEAQWSVLAPVTSTLALDDKRFVAPPSPGHSLLVAVSAGTNDKPYVSHAFDPTPTGMHLVFELYPDVLSAAGDNPFVVRFTMGSQYLALYVAKDSTSVQEAFPTDAGPKRVAPDHRAKDPIAEGKWTKVDLLVRFATSEVSLSLDGVPQFTDKLDPAWVPEPPVLEVGCVYANDPVAKTFHFDNLVLDVF